MRVRVAKVCVNHILISTSPIVALSIAIAGATVNGTEGSVFGVGVGRSFCVKVCVCVGLSALFGLVYWCAALVFSVTQRGVG